MDFLNLGVVVTLVLGLTQWVKERLGLVDRPAEVLSFAIGALGGGVYQFAVSHPIDFNGWLSVVIVALLMALVPSGIFKFGSQLASEANKSK